MYSNQKGAQTFTHNCTFLFSSKKFHMTIEITLCKKHLKGVNIPVVSIDTFVFFKVPQVGEALSTFITHVGLLPRVHLEVSLQAVGLIKTLPTYTAAEGLLSCVYALVSVKISQSSKVLATHITAERFVPSVNTLVCLQTALLSECLSTFLTAEGLLSCVDFFVGFQVAG